MSGPKGGRPKNSKEVGRKVRWIVDKALDILEQKSGLDAAEMLADEMIEQGITNTLPKFASFYPKEVHAEVTTRTVEDFVLDRAKQRQEEHDAESGSVH